MTSRHQDLEDVLLNLPAETQAELQCLFPRNGAQYVNGKFCDAVDLEKLKAKLDQREFIGSMVVLWIESTLSQINRDIEKNRVKHDVELRQLDEAVKRLKKEGRLAADSSVKLEVRQKIQNIEAQRNIAWEKYDEQLKNTEQRKDKQLLNLLESTKKQTLEKEILSLIAERRKK